MDVVVHSNHVVTLIHWLKINTVSFIPLKRNYSEAHKIRSTLSKSTRFSTTSGNCHLAGQQTYCYCSFFWSLVRSFVGRSLAIVFVHADYSHNPIDAYAPTVQIKTYNEFIGSNALAFAHSIPVFGFLPFSFRFPFLPLFSVEFKMIKCFLRKIDFI